MSVIQLAALAGPPRPRLTIIRLPHFHKLSGVPHTSSSEDDALDEPVITMARDLSGSPCRRSRSISIW